MKQILLICAFATCSAAAFALPVPAEKLSIYKKAVDAALSNYNLACTFTPEARWNDDQRGSAELIELVDQATSAEINESGSQPVLTFHYDGPDGCSDNTLFETIAITTSSDYRTISSVDFSQYIASTKQVNIGTILNPNFVTQDVQLDSVSVSCK